MRIHTLDAVAVRDLFEEAGGNVVDFDAWLDDIRDASYRRGYVEGSNDVNNEAYNQGYEDGRADA